jgi:hypothetical protein
MPTLREDHIMVTTPVHAIVCVPRLTLTTPKVFAGKEPNRALGLSSLKEKDCVADYESLSEKEQGVLNDWYTFFSKRYNIIGRLADDPGSNL